MGTDRLDCAVGLLITQLYDVPDNTLTSLISFLKRIDVERHEARVTE